MRPILVNGLIAALGAFALSPIDGAVAAQVPSVGPKHPGAEVIEGLVTTDSGSAIQGADVIATRAPDRAFKATKTDSAGRFRIIFDESSGDYLVHAAAVGREAARKRVTRVGSDSVLRADFRLRSSVQQLETVRVDATKPRPSRDAGFDNAAGSSEKTADGVRAAVPPGLAGDLSAIASTIPGVTLTPSGISVLGLGSDQNRTTLNGMSFAGTDVPRDARVRTRVTTSSYDPARGWFGGAEQGLELDAGDLFSFRHAHVTLDAPFLQYGDALSSSAGQQYTNVALSLGGNGSFDEDKYSYNYGVEAGRRQSDVAGIETADSDVLQQAGVSPDSVSRFLEILRANGIPVATTGETPSLVNDRASFILRLDHKPYDWKNFTESKTTWGLVGYGKLARSQRIGLTPLGTIDHGAESNQALGSVQALYSGFINDKYLADARSSITIGRNRLKPQLSLPDGVVLVTSLLSDGSPSVSRLAFGGNGTLERNTTDWTWESQLVNQFYLHGRAGHLIRFSADARLDGFDHEQSDNRLGTFVFSSLADLTGNRAATFSRTLTGAKTSSTEWNAFVAVGDSWRKTPKLQFLYGARFEGNRFTSAPVEQSEIRNTFGVSTASVPNTFHVSPRFGFTWLRQRASYSRMVSPMGEFYRDPPNYLRGGIGEFRSMLMPDILEAGLRSDVASETSRMLRCDGPAAPSPDWSTLIDNPGAIPAQCLPGTIPVFTDEAPVTHLFASDYTAPRSWRANLGYAWSRGSLALNVEGIVSINLNQAGRENINFSDRARFVVSDEGRPVFVGPSSIVPNSGIVSAVESRRSAQFGPVIEQRSNLRSVSRQLTFTATPEFKARWVFASGSYTLSSMSTYGTGFDHTTFLSPARRERARGDFDARHQFRLQGGFVRNGFVVTLFTRIQSGLPFTPMIASDVNGDGLANDRAFIFDPSTAIDATVAAATQSLMGRSANSVRDCVRSQIGRAARWNSCEGPWAAAMDVQITKIGTTPVMKRSAEISLALSNALGGIDRLIHGATSMRGWGSTAAPDPNLYFVRGFDPVVKRFKYDVNSRFGDTRGSAVGRSPFRLTLDVSMDIGVPFPQQQLSRWIDPGRNGHPGPKLSVDELKKRYRRSVANPYAGILEETDSLLLTREQVDSLKVIQSHYVAKMDTLWTELAEYLAALGDHFDAAEALRRQEEATDKGWEITRLDLQSTLPTVLSPVQLQLLPNSARFLFKATRPVHVRTFNSG